MLSLDEWDFIDGLSGARLPLRQNFETALEIEPQERYEWAQDQVYDIKRVRFFKRGIPEHDTETVGEHTLEAVGLATLHTPDYCLRDTVERMIFIHDLPQSIIDNLKCDESIKPNHKKRAEYLAAKVVFESVPAAFALWEEYEQGQSHEARIAKDMQHVQMMMKIADYERAYPATTPHFKSYWDEIESVWVSDIGHKLQQLIMPRLPVCANDDTPLQNPDGRSCIA